jgi:hypothetical protein
MRHPRIALPHALSGLLVRLTLGAVGVAGLCGLISCAGNAPPSNAAAASQAANAASAAAAQAALPASASMVAKAQPPAAPPPPPAPVPILPFDEAVQSAANNLLAKAQLPPDTKWDVVIDPLIDGVTGAETLATRAMGGRIVKIIKENYPRYEVQAFTLSNVQRAPLLLVGTFTGVNGERKTEGKREAYRICLALADLKTGKLVSKGLAFATPEGVDATPTPLYRDAPAWLEDKTALGYIRTCQGTRAGDSINAQYVDRVLTAATLAEASDAYSAGKYANALKLYETASASPGGDQLRTYTGLYLTNWRLGKRAAAAQAFGKIVEQGLENKRLGVKFLFRPGAAALWTDPKTGPTPYPVWLQEIAARAKGHQSCLEVVGHTSATGPEALNERLSVLRAEAIRNQITGLAPELGKRTIANGVGSRQTMIGTGRDDLSDALDRRVEFKVVGC